MEFELLELLSLVSKMTQELSDHVGMSDKTIAEFIIDIHKTSNSPKDFNTTSTRWMPDSRIHSWKILID